MDPAWVSIGALVVMLVANLVMFAYFMGGVNAKLNALKDSIDALKSVDSRLAVNEERLATLEEGAVTLGGRIENHARQILAIARGDRLPPDFSEGVPVRSGRR